MTKPGSAPKPSILEGNGVRLNLSTREVVCDGIRVDLTPLEFDILAILMRSVGRVVSSDELISALVGKGANPFVGDLDIHVHQLKHKLERGRRLIGILQEAGYFFVPPDEHGANGYKLA
jgi:DNA-binding response OmpR family regulator